MLVSGLCQNNKIKIVRTAGVKFDILSPQNYVVNWKMINAWLHGHEF
jgi:hypothetical protein